MMVSLIITKEGYKREIHGAYLDGGTAGRMVREMNKAVKKEKYECVNVEVR